MPGRVETCVLMGPPGDCEAGSGEHSLPTGSHVHHQLPEEGDALRVWEGKQEEAADPQAARHLR